MTHSIPRANNGSLDIFLGPPQRFVDIFRQGPLDFDRTSPVPDSPGMYCAMSSLKVSAQSEGSRSVDW